MEIDLFFLLFSSLFVEKINKSERKSLSELIQMNQGEETTMFWNELGGKPGDFQLIQHVPDDFVPQRAILYKVDLGQEFIELPQGSLNFSRSNRTKVRFSSSVELEPGGVLKKELLNTNNIYILDCFTELFIW